MGAIEDRLRGSLLRGHQITELVPPEPLIEDLLDLNSTAVLFGPSGAGKSLIALDWALHVASGLDWWGRPTQHGPVLYVVAEGAHGTRFRYESWCEYHGIDRVDDILWMTMPANVLRDEDRNTLFKLAAEEGPIFVVLDTLARHMPGGDENSFETMSVVVETIDQIKRMTKGCVMPVHHTGKDDAAGARGHSSLKGSLDVELSVKTSRPEGRMACSVYAEKMKDREDHRVLYQAVMERVGESLVPVVQGEAALRPYEQQMLTSLNGQWTSYTDWWTASGVSSKSTFSRGQHRLLELGLIEHDPQQGWRTAHVH